ncbi:MAG: FAD-dependent oxidoreductase [Chloroflexi bacterium]|nr:FAD-dependent oxidoreductase [Chloroflexota bacterium]
MANKKKVCIVGGGATGAALLWAIAQDPQANQEWDITLIHNQQTAGGHSLTYTTTRNGETLYIDIGVQFISPMLYPNVHAMLKLPDFQSVEVRDYNQLQIAAAFPRDANNNMQNWGNFPDYQTGPQFSTLYNQDMQFDIGAFQTFIEVSLAMGWATKSLADYFANPPTRYSNQQQFINYLLAPYLSIINGYGAALLDQTTFVDLFPLFAKLPLPHSWGTPTPLGSFSNPGVGWQRFAQGAQSWVQAMASAALKYAPSSTLILNSNVTAVSTDQNTGQVNVQWTTNGVQNSGTFDKVVLTTDMWTNSKILNNPQNQYFWNNLYKTFIGYGEDQNGNPLGQPVVWPLMYGACYIHTDETMLSPDLLNQEETLQFNAYYAGTGGGNYDLTKTFTTYIQKNVLGTPSNPDVNADGIYLSMYGYVPQPGTDKMPDPAKVLYSQTWTHGKWTPASMGGPKANLYMAQGLGNIQYQGQMNTNVYFAGNNTTADSEEGALDSALAIANYAFGVEYPLAGINPFPFTMYYIYHNVMFPKQNAAHAIASIYHMLPVKEQTMAAAPRTARSQTKAVAGKKKTSSKMAATKKTGPKPAKTKAIKKSVKSQRNRKKPVGKKGAPLQKAQSSKKIIKKPAIKPARTKKAIARKNHRK